jgi:hypothetical protein
MCSLEMCLQRQMVSSNSALRAHSNDCRWGPHQSFAPVVRSQGESGVAEWSMSHLMLLCEDRASACLVATETCATNHIQLQCRECYARRGAQIFTQAHAGDMNTSRSGMQRCALRTGSIGDGDDTGAAEDSTESTRRRTRIA